VTTGDRLIDSVRPTSCTFRLLMAKLLASKKQWCTSILGEMTYVASWGILGACKNLTLHEKLAYMLKLSGIKLAAIVVMKQTS